MLKNKLFVQSKWLQTSRLLVALFAGLIYSHAAYALEVNVATMLDNFTKTVPNLMRLVTACAYVIGMFLVYRGLMELKRFSEQRTMMTGEHHIGKPLSVVFIGAMLIYLPSSVNVGLSTFWTNATPFAYVSDSTDSWSELIKDCFMVLQLIGTISFIRGLIQLSNMGHGHQSNFGKAMAHIIAGILCIDMYDFITAVFNTLALGQI